MTLDRNGTPTWQPATGIQMPQIPTVSPGEDPMSAAISAILPTLGAPLQANIAALQGKETMFSGKLAAADVAYQGSEDSGEQGVMQIVQMLGQMGGQAGQMAGAPMQMAGQIPSSFGSLMQPMMQAFQGAGHGGGEHGSGGQASASASAGAGGGQGAGGMPSAQQQERDEAKPAQAGPQQERDRDDRAAAGPQAGPGDIRHGLSPVPVLPPEHSHGDEGDDLGRRM